MAFSYYGGFMEAWAQLTLHGIRGGGSVNVLFTVLSQKRSNTAEAVWWTPRGGSAVIALGNSSDQQVHANLIFSTGESQTVDVAPFGTEIVRLHSDTVGPASTDRVEAVSINYTGPAGALIPTGYTASDDGKFASMIRFYDTQHIVQQNLFANNFRLTKAVPHMVLRNVSADFITAVPTFLPASGDPNQAVKLQPVRLAPSETIEINLTPLLQAASNRSDLDSVSVQVMNKGSVGSLIGALYSINRQTGVTYDVPLRDSGPPRASTGGYPIRLDGDYATVITITNTAEKAGDFTMQINYDGGPYIIGMIGIAPGATKTFDIRKIRDDQKPDVWGHTLPGDLQVAQAKWSIRHDVRLNGRAEVVSLKDGVSSSYSCSLCCPNSFGGATLSPQNPTIWSGDTQTLTIMEQDTNGYYCGGDTGWFPYGGNQFWWSDNDYIATVNYGDVTGQNPGTTTINVDITACTWTWDEIDESCNEDEWPTDAYTGVTVPQVSINEVGFTGDYPLTKWSDGSAIDSPDGSSPTWKSSNNPDLPAAYEYCSTVTMFAKLGISASAPSKTATLRVKSGADVIGTKDISLSGTNVNVTGIGTTLALSNTVGVTTPSFGWELSLDGGSNWSSIGTSGPHKIYWTYSAPLSPPFRGDDGFDYSALYDLALDKACGYANGIADLGTIIGNINSGVDNQTRYNPGNSISTLHPLSAYDEAEGIQCSDETNLLRGLLRSIGIDGTVLFIWAGPDATTLTRYTIGTTGINF